MLDGIGSANGRYNSQQSMDVQCIQGYNVVNLQNSAAILFSTRTVRLFENIWQSTLKKKTGKTRAWITKRKEKG